MNHHPNCIANAIQAIADNNGWTLTDAPNTHESALTPETASEAKEWLANGNALCWQDGELCND